MQDAAPEGLNQAPAGPTAIITILHPLGLHLRTGKDVVQTASRFEATITARNLTRASPAVDAKSIIQLMQLQARHGHQLQLEAAGPDAQAAIEALRGIFEAPQQAGPVHS